MKRTARKVNRCRLGVYDACDPAGEVVLVGEEFRFDHRRDRAVMRMTIQLFNRKAKRLCMGVFPVK